jgi:hypothetical protein
MYKKWLRYRRVSDGLTGESIEIQVDLLYEETWPANACWSTSAWAQCAARNTLRPGGLGVEDTVCYDARTDGTSAQGVGDPERCNSRHRIGEGLSTIRSRLQQGMMINEGRCVWAIQSLHMSIENMDTGKGTGSPRTAEGAECVRLR